MIVDLNTRVWSSIDALGPSAAEAARRRKTEPWEDAAATPELHAAAMEPVTCAVVLGFESGLLGGGIDADAVAAAVAADPGRTVGFVGIDPMLGGAVDKLKAALDRGLSGVTVSPAAAGFHPADMRAMALYEACVEHGVPVLVETAATLCREARMEFARPYLFDEVARALPELRLVLSGFGRPWIEQGVAMMAKHPRVYGDVSGLVQSSWQLYNALVHAEQAGVMGQVLFGSGFPFCTPERAIKTLYSVNTITQGTPLPGVPREQLRGVVERDTLAELGITSPRAAETVADAAEPAAGAAMAETPGATGMTFERVEVTDGEPPRAAPAASAAPGTPTGTPALQPPATPSPTAEAAGGGS